MRWECPRLTINFRKGNFPAKNTYTEYYPILNTHSRTHIRAYVSTKIPITIQPLITNVLLSPVDKWTVPEPGSTTPVQNCDKFHGPSGLTPPGYRKDIPDGLLTSLSVVKRLLHTLVDVKFLPTSFQLEVKPPC